MVEAVAPRDRFVGVSFRREEETISVQRYVLLLTLCAATIAFGTAPSSATFPGEDGRIAFDAFRAKTDSGEIFTAASDGSDLQKLTSAPNHFSVLPDSWPGRAANRLHSGDLRWRQPGYSDLCDERGRKRPREAHPRPWSPRRPKLVAGRKHACDQVRLGPRRALQGIWIIPASDPDGVTEEEAARVTTIPASAKFDFEPQFSPDGSSIVFTRFKSRRRSAIHRVNIDGTGLERLTRWRLNASNPDWSPDGQSIAFDSGDSGTPGSKGDIYVIRADGSGRTRLTDRPRFHEGGRFDLTGNPCWSPSGTQIMYTHFLPNGTGTLMAMNADGSDKHVVIDRPRTPNKVDWGTHP